ncbi:RNA polymerase sigma factor [Rubinisphaera margarita]|uniref:RNA polymerase sigma factor n=1 Tax=Rubinisphaera margarita TaxID=2909586 RepID=UPI001EE8BBDC|nr:sigma-70 family RNA polymerase sigma factor [Rubinisphaera margarita]MCG6154658.1 sigma-70 family RNA polymerase sigma factor [Rubinisphaera margarita]
MNNGPGYTTILQSLLDRLNRGEDAARAELISHAMKRLRGLARTMLRQNLAVQRFQQTDDVLQNALLRLNNALKAVRPEDSDRFMGLAATQIRRELIDLWRHHYGPLGAGGHHHSDPGLVDSRGIARPLYDPGRDEPRPSETLAIHEAVDLLTADQREVFEKRLYLEMTHEEIAVEMHLSLKTVKRRWREAKQQLAVLLDPDADGHQARNEG